MIARASGEESAFRRGSRGREPIAHPSEEHVHYVPSKQTGLGCVTSRPRPTHSFFEVLAFELKCNVETAKRLYEEGLVP